ncbi:hypothetical protein FOA43_002232 [Brettanomyces nanus]|uniref:RAD50-interacting protein 1 n=1 Tax=Eeniella nana TaxID=13502 RepID=A0A875S3E7_EENNA|nr:uncharacterized protein FOA43_002232 [Brettanomyces nanus]QPG74895.1 hypothetical protein FOA43_002232 [Brettanomyces nanus]
MSHDGSDSTIQRFLNTTFSSVDDLGHIDHLISEIEQARSTLRQKAESHQEDKEDDAKVSQILDQLNKLVDTDDISGLDSLISRYGEIEMFLVVKGKMVEKLKLEEAKKAHKLYVELSGKLNNFELFDLADDSEKSDGDKLAKLKELYAEVAEFIKTNAGKKDLPDYSSFLNQKLSAIILENFKEMAEKSLKESLSDYDTEKKKFSTNEMKLMNTNFASLLELQSLDPIYADPHYPSTFWAMDCLCGRFKISFIYHFEGKSETNRLDKPEYALDYILGYLQKTLPLIRMLFDETFLCYHPKKSIDDAFITSLLASAREKFQHDRNLCLVNKKLLSHLISELQKFDRTLLEDFNYKPVGKIEKWSGLTYDLILSDSSVFDRWLNNEKEFVNSRYDEIINAKDAFIIDYDFVELGHTQPTKSAISMSNLLDGITSNYENLPLEYQLKFLSDVQLKLLNFYYTVLKQGVKALDSVARNDEVSFTERLCRIWCSAQYMVELMSRWGERLFFIELWNSINPDNDCQNTFFDSVIAGYRRDILDQLPKKLKQNEERRINKSMKDYFQNYISWRNVRSINSHPVELELPIHTLSNDLEFLRKTVSGSTFYAIKLYFSEVISEYFIKNFISCNTFNPLGAAQLRKHVDMFYESLQLTRDYEHYDRLCEMIDVFGSTDIDPQNFKILSEQEVDDLIRRRSRD